MRAKSLFKALACVALISLFSAAPATEYKVGYAITKVHNIKDGSPGEKVISNVAVTGFAALFSAAGTAGGAQVGATMGAVMGPVGLVLGAGFGAL